MKEAILMGKTNAIGEVMHSGWESKKKMAEGISNPEIDKIYATAMQNGATGGKIKWCWWWRLFFLLLS